MTPEALQSAARHLRNAQVVLVSTGAGMSQESGIPTFRDAQDGLWARFNPEELATEDAFRSAPARVWSWYADRRARMAACSPHAGHRALVELEAMVPELVVVTQNIDGLHQVAGSRDVVELHGRIDRFRCIDCRRAPESVPPVVESPGLEHEPPPCEACGSALRPDVVWFGEMLPRTAVERAWALARSCDALLVIGTSGVVWPAAELPHLARREGTPVIEISPEPTAVTPVSNVFLEGRAGEILPLLVEAIRAGA